MPPRPLCPCSPKGGASDPGIRLRSRPQPRRKRAIRPLAPETIERMRAFALADDRPKEAALLAVMGYAGLPPGEAFALTWVAPPPEEADLMFPRTDGEVFRDTDYRNWRKRHFTPGAVEAGVGEATPMRFGTASPASTAQAGWNPLEIAVEMGNSPEVVQRDYSHLFREFARGERIDPEATIREAREAAISA